jgi:hypothetical protein
VSKLNLGKADKPSQRGDVLTGVNLPKHETFAEASRDRPRKLLVG